jgi:dTDP-4-dehydrorhamnose 3,5-epimerase-like enzyme
MDHSPSLIEVSNFIDMRGSLGVVEDSALPFDIRRMYYLFDVPLGAVRGEHGHKKLQQLILCLNGQCDITLNDGHRQYHFELPSPAQGLFVPPGLWRQLRFREPATVCCVLASMPYDKDDYIFSFDEFEAWVRAKEAAEAEILMSDDLQVPAQ